MNIIPFEEERRFLVVGAVASEIDAETLKAYCTADLHVGMFSPSHVRVSFPILEKPSRETLSDERRYYIVPDRAFQLSEWETVPYKKDRRPEIARRLGNHPRSPRRV